MPASHCRRLKTLIQRPKAASCLTFLIKKHGYAFALSEEGAIYTSAKFAARIGAIQKKLIFVIGGPLGLSPAVKNRADEILSLSRMTFSHEMVQLFLLEQIYRGISINLNRKYHKA